MGMIYFFRSPSTRLVKIGFSKRPQSRYDTLCSEYREALEPIGVLDGDGRKDETRVQKMFAPHFFLREWFAITNEQIAALHPEPYPIVPPWPVNEKPILLLRMERPSLRRRYDAAWEGKNGLLFRYRLHQWRLPWEDNEHFSPLPV